MSDILDDYEDAMFDRGKIVEHIPIARLRELADAEKDGRVVILGKAYKEPNGMFTVLYRRHDGVMMGRTDFTAEEAEQNAKAEAARAESAEAREKAIVDYMRGYCQFCEHDDCPEEDPPCCDCENVTHDGRECKWELRGLQPQDGEGK